MSDFISDTLRPSAAMTMITKTVRAAIRSAGVDIWPAPVEQVLAGALYAFVIADRERSADLVMEACRSYESLDSEQLSRLAALIADRDGYGLDDEDEPEAS
jgi:hypothetical protein